MKVSLNFDRDVTFSRTIIFCPKCFGVHELSVCPKECIALLLPFSTNNFCFPRLLVTYIFCKI
jgi:hypothetical protein